MKDIEARIQKYLTDRGWSNLRPVDLVKSISIESGELLELFQWTNPSKQELLKDPEFLEEVKKELADVFIYALDLSVTLGLDTKQIIFDKLEQIEKKYPAEVMRNQDKEAGDEYYRLKKLHRTKNS